MHCTRTLTLAALGLALLAGACHRSELPQGVMDTASMVAFLTDAYRLEGYFAIESNHNYDTVSPEVLRAYDDILRRHGISRAQADSSLAYYAERPEIYAGMLDAVVQRLEAERKGPSGKEEPIGASVKL